MVDRRSSYGKLVFENEYGRVVFERVSEYKPVREAGRVRDLPQDVRITLEQAEQVALITGNAGIQVAPNMENLRECAVLSHASSSVAAWVRVKELVYVGGRSATDVLRTTRYALQVGEGW